jgi:uncharacterized membrane protein YvbJ
MERVVFCRHCGELLEDNWIHCPWCGKEILHSRINLKAFVEESLDRTVEENSRGSMGRLEEISERLDTLELELDTFLAQKIK